MPKLKPTRLMRISALWFPLLAGSLCSALHAQQLPQILILGTTHFDNPNHDIANMVFHDMLTPERQRQMDELLKALARFRPTRICIEVAPEHPADSDRRYTEYLAGPRGRVLHCRPTRRRYIDYCLRRFKADKLTRFRAHLMASSRKQIKEALA